MEFQVLGPLKVVEGDRDLTPVRPKQRALLAMLLLHRGEVVPGARLIEALWGEEPPGTAQTALHGHISALRKRVGADFIRTRPPGYLLQVPAVAVDLARFETLIVEARRRVDAEDRSSGLREALALWRGEPLADLRYEPFAQSEISRIEELRLGALEDRFDADLALGRHHELVAEIEPLVAATPFRERVRAQLMLALYRCGRQTDALQVFKNGRKTLVEEVGIEPGPSLQQLERQILNQDPSLQLATEAPWPTAVEDAPTASPVEAGVAPGRPELAEERKVATILFADVIGSTELGDRLDPERLRALLRTYFEAMSEVITSWGGTLEKYIGDAIVAVFGVPTAHEDDPVRAIRAAVEMLERLDQLNRSFQQRHEITLAIRIGINTGEVLASVGAAGDRLVAGDAVNVAARLEQSAEPGTVLVGERTQLAARRHVLFGQPMSLEVKGKTGPLIVHRVEGLRSRGEARVTLLRSPLVGRARELNQLNELLNETLAAAKPHFMLAYGPAGIGKSRLITEFLAGARARSELHVLTGRCRATGRGMTYWALAEILRQAFEIALDDSADVAAEKMLRGARAALAGLELPEDEAARTICALATTAGIPLPDNPLSELEPRLVVEELARAWPCFATALARRRPTILVVEDLHWAGEPLLDMLARLIGRSDGSLLIVATARPEFAAARPGFMASHEGATAISLQSLTEPEATALVEGLLQSVDLPGELRRAIVRTADGNPFFLEEIVLQMIDTGVIVRQRDRWRASDQTASIALPDTVHGVISARLDALAGADKRVLQEAAVVGRRFWLEPLARVLSETAVTSALLRLEERGLVVARPTSSLSGQAEYQFKHALVRDVAYAGLPKVRRARAHAEHAVWLEKLASDHREELAELIAAHYTSALAGEDADLAWADDPAGWQRTRTRGFEALLEAGDAARRRFAVTRALELHEQALGLASGNGLERGRALAALGDDHDAAYHGDEAFKAYLPALELLRGEPGADSLRAHICLMASRMAAVKWGGFRSRPTPQLWDSLVDEGLAAARDDETRAWLTVLKGNVGVRRMRLMVEDPLSLDERLQFAKAGLDAAERLDRPAVLSQSYRTAGLLHSLAGDWDRTLELARRDIRLADRLDPAGRAFALFWNALFFMEIAGEFRESAGFAERSLGLARSLTPHERMHGTYTVMHARYHLGTWSELDVLASEHVAALASEPGIGCPYARSGQLVAALGLAHQGRLDRAAELAALVTPDLEKPALSEALLARYLVARGDAAGGRELAEKIVGRTIYAEENAYEILAMLEALVALEDWDALTAYLPRARACSDALALVEPASDRAAGIASAAAGDRATAEECLTRALGRFEQLGIVFDAALTKEWLAAVAPRGRATRLRREALATFEQLEASPHAERLQAASWARTRPRWARPELPVLL